MQQWFHHQHDGADSAEVRAEVPYSTWSCMPYSTAAFLYSNIAKAILALHGENLKLYKIHTVNQDLKFKRLGSSSVIWNLYFIMF